MFPGLIHTRRDTGMGHLVIMRHLAPTLTDTGKATVTTAAITVGTAPGTVTTLAVAAGITTDPGHR